MEPEEEQQLWWEIDRPLYVRAVLSLGTLLTVKQRVTTAISAKSLEKGITRLETIQMRLVALNTSILNNIPSTVGHKRKSLLSKKNGDKDF